MTSERCTRDAAAAPRKPGHALLALIFAIALGACGDDSTGPESYEDISGTYVGSLAATSQGVTLVADFSLTFNQSSGDLSGSWSLAGQASDGVSVADILGSGTLSGTIQSGSNPSVNVTVANACPGYTAQFSGAYDSSNNRLTITGPVQILDGCTVVWTSTTTIILNR